MSPWEVPSPLPCTANFGSRFETSSGRTAIATSSLFRGAVFLGHRCLHHGTVLLRGKEHLNFLSLSRSRGRRFLHFFVSGAWCHVSSSQRCDSVALNWPHSTRGGLSLSAFRGVSDLEKMCRSWEWGAEKRESDSLPVSCG